MAKYVLLLEYDGSEFCGWQIQANSPSIQGALELALSIFANEKITTVTAGRTDAKVHALNQVIHFVSSAKRQLEGWVKGVNSNLPYSIRVKSVKEVALDFDARFSALSRTYHYYLALSPYRPTHLRHHVGWYYRDLDCALMQEAANCLVGVNDFSSFRAAGCQANTPIRNLSTIIIERRGDMVRFALTANAFLQHMVRNIVGALVYVGEGRLSVSEFKIIFEVANRRLAPPTFMPNGLYLVNVDYLEPMFVTDFNLWRFYA